jgi:hypothetical protein
MQHYSFRVIGLLPHGEPFGFSRLPVYLSPSVGRVRHRVPHSQSLPARSRLMADTIVLETTQGPVEILTRPD